jgi:undecaprenyl-diphosphatase
VNIVLKPYFAQPQLHCLPLIFTGMDRILALDRDLLILINSFHTDWLDPIMLLITKTFFWTPLYLFFIFLMFKKLGPYAWYALAGAALTILLADGITAHIMKPYFQRLRPSQDPSVQNLLHLVSTAKDEVYRGGLYGFASSHAANTFGTAMFMWLLLRDKINWIVLAFIWAACMTYTRLYLGVHFPGDILVGGLVGLLSGYAGYRLFLWLKKRKEAKLLGY